MWSSRAIAFSGLAAESWAPIAETRALSSAVWCCPARRETRISRCSRIKSSAPATSAATPACHEIDRAMPR